MGLRGLSEPAEIFVPAARRAVHRGFTDRGELSAHELQIATLAAQGLTNRQIGERLFLSHRTVGLHLYRLFPKLGVSSRSELREALGEPVR